MSNRIISALKRLWNLLTLRQPRLPSKNMATVITGIESAVKDLPVYKRRNRQIRRVYIMEFNDAYLFLLKLCNPRYIKYCHGGGHVRYVTEFPDNVGRLELTDRKRRTDKRVLAEMSVEIDAIKEEVNRIIFIRK